MDLLAGSLDSKGVKAWKNEGPDSWMSIKGRFPATGTFYGMTTADLDKDGHDDICAASFGEGLKVWLGKERGSVSSKDEKAKDIPVQDHPAVSEAPEENSVFTAVSGVPEYRVGPGDVLEITLWKGTVATRELITVQAVGKISFGMLEDLDVKGLTASQMDEVITRDLKQYIKHPRVDVLVKEYKSKFVTILGPGVSYGGRSGGGRRYLTRRTTIVEILAQTADLSKDANLSQVGLRRENGQSLKLNLFKAILQGKAGQDVVLDAGDVIYVPIITKEANRVYIFGEVGKPGVYPFIGSEMRLLDVVSQAGGFTVFAHEDSTKIVRGDPTRPEVISADLKKLLEEGDQTQNVALANGDLVYVPRSFIGDVNRFSKQIRPLMEIMLTPARIINEYDQAYNILKK